MYKQGEIIYRWIIPNFFIAGISFTPFKNEKNNEEIDLQSKKLNKNDSFESSSQNVLNKWSEILVFGIRVTNNENFCETDLPESNQV